MWLQVTSLAEVWIEIALFNVSLFIFLVTSLAEVWIEIYLTIWDRKSKICHFPCGSVDWNAAGGDTAKAAFSHFPCGSVDWNIYIIGKEGKEMSHFPCGSVDWNRGANVQMQYNGVTSLAEVWIEMEHLLISMIAVTVTSLAEVWIEIQNQQDFSVYWLSPPLRKCGLKFASVPDLIYSYGRHFPCGSVDWNSHKAGLHDHPDVTSLAEVWIEISLLPPKT